MTMPRLELSSAVLAVKLNNILRKQLQLKVDKVIFWSDSTIVLQYINNSERRFQVFVANRLSKIADGSTPSQWRHVSGVHNPADDATRGLAAKDMVHSSRWFNAPPFSFSLAR